MEATNSDIIFEFLDCISPEAACDDCISSKTDVSPRQQVNQICNRLASQEILVRQNDLCSLCGRQKRVNSLTSTRNHSEKGVERKGTSSHIRPSRSIDREPDIEYIRNEIVRICYKIWHQDHSEEHQASQD